MEHPVALDDHLGILEHQVAGSECPVLRLPPAEDDRHDVDRHVVDDSSFRQESSPASPERPDRQPHSRRTSLEPPAD
jgi:hypothetical protein